MTATAAIPTAGAPAGGGGKRADDQPAPQPVYSSDSASSTPTASDATSNGGPGAAFAPPAADPAAARKPLLLARALSPADAAPRRDQGAAGPGPADAGASETEGSLSEEGETSEGEVHAEVQTDLLLAPKAKGSEAAAAAAPEGAVTSEEQRERGQEQEQEEAVLTGKILDAPAGTRVWCDGMTPDSRQPWWDELLALSTLAIFTCWIHILGALMVWALFNKWAALAVAALWATALLPAEPLLWEGFLGNPIFKSWRRYFRFSVAYDTPIDLSKTYVYSEVPHSVFPLSQLIATSLGADAWQGHKVYSIAADSVLRIPLWRHIFSWVGARPATAKMFKWLLREKGSVGLIPGGIAEMFMSEAPAADVVKLNDRKGFIRVAVETGTPVVPIHHFGAWDLCRWAAPQSWAALSRRLRTSLGFVVGRYGLPLPHRVPLFMAVGAPVPVPKMSPQDPGFAETVDAIHAQVVEAHRSLFYRYRPLYPSYESQNREIKIV